MTHTDIRTSGLDKRSHRVDRQYETYFQRFV